MVAPRPDLSSIGQVIILVGMCRRVYVRFPLRTGLHCWKLCLRSSLIRVAVEPKPTVPDLLCILEVDAYITPPALCVSKEPARSCGPVQQHWLVFAVGPLSSEWPRHLPPFNLEFVHHERPKKVEVKVVDGERPQSPQAPFSALFRPRFMSAYRSTHVHHKERPDRGRARSPFFPPVKRVHATIQSENRVPCFAPRSDSSG